MSLTGNYFPLADSINMDVNIESLRLDLLSPYLQDNISNLAGNASGNLHIAGKTNHPSSSGMLKLQDASFTINDLQTTYHCNDSIKITPTEFQFNQFRLIDENDHTAVVYGVISHNQFNDFNLDLAVNFLNFNILDTKLTDNETFYGQVYLTGITRLYGAFDDLDIEITAKTDKETKVFIPLNNSGDIQKVTS